MSVWVWSTVKEVALAMFGCLQSIIMLSSFSVGNSSNHQLSNEKYREFYELSLQKYLSLAALSQISRLISEMLEFHTSLFC